MNSPVAGDLRRHDSHVTSLWWRVAVLTADKIVSCQPRQQSSWGQPGAPLGPVGPRWAPCWPHEPCYHGVYSFSPCNKRTVRCTKLCGIVVIAYFGIMPSRNGKIYHIADPLYRALIVVKFKKLWTNRQVVGEMLRVSAHINWPHWCIQWDIITLLCHRLTALKQLIT